MSAYTGSIPLGHLDPDREAEPVLWELLLEWRRPAPPATVPLQLAQTTVMQVTP